MDFHLEQLKRNWLQSGDYHDLQAYVRGLRRAGYTQLEVLDGWPEQVLGQFWPDVTYKGLNCVDLLTRIDELRNPEQEIEDCTDAQECYMGYIPSLDWIVVGWDAWFEPEDLGWYSDEDDDQADPEPEMYGYAQAYQVNRPQYGSEPFYLQDQQIFRMPGGFYRRPRPLYERIRETYPDLIGLRYD